MLSVMKCLGGYRVGILAALAALAFLACDADERICTAIGCSNDVVLWADIPSSASELTVHACQEGNCLEVELDASQPCAELSSALPLEHACLFERSGAWRVEVAFSLNQDWSSDDVYSVRITDRATGVVLQEGEDKATYSVSYPNGRECDRVGCWRGTLRFEPPS